MADAETVRKQRQKQLEDKRRRLEQLRKRKKDKETATITKAADDAAARAGAGDAESPSSSTSWDASRSSPGGGGDLDAYIQQLITTPTPGQPTAGDGAAREGGGNGLPNASSTSPALEGSSTRTATRLSLLTISTGLGTVTVPPKVAEFYDKGCQADLGGGPSAIMGNGGTDEDGDAIGALSSAAKKTPDRRRNHLRVFGLGGRGVPVPDGSEGEDQGHHPGLFAGSPSPLRPLLRPSASTPGSASGRSFEKNGGNGMPLTPPVAAKTLSAEEKKEMVQADHFQDFLRRSSRTVERALGEAAALDILLDYAADEGDNSRGDQGQHLNEAMALHEDRWCQERALTDLQWSPHRPELVLACYSARGHGLDATSSSSLHTDADGLVLMWSMAMQHRPEYQLSSQSPVLTARFHPFDTHVIIGGTYSGQVVVWDTRAKSLPVQRTPLSATGHTYPVYNLHVGGTENAPSLLTASTDGRVSRWNPSQLSQPLQDMHLSHGGNPVTVSSMALAQGEEQKELVVGSESGGIYTTPLHFRNSGVVEEYLGHHGLVTSVDANPSPSKSLRGLLLSSSVDWTTRLWHLARGKAPIQSLTHGTYDYVCDAKWSPKHPALFVTANISGELGLWNLNHSMEEPLSPPVKVVDRCALTRMAWSPDGRRLCVGDAKGYARVFNMDPETALPKADEDLKLEASLAVKAKGVFQA